MSVKKKTVSYNTRNSDNLHTSHDARDFMYEGRLSYSSFINVNAGPEVLSIPSVAYSSSACNKVLTS